ncbi:MBL fold metallo-hydrolase [Rubrobacter tropicus]|uniref:MBL fold metallo-hydrolase n=1 Tax=Rubrobacter tropicus TaxID=2653851 RepID=A0A6G8Q4F1_9ACTN|nr:MBL fold metallo-hydrolase [Rubrobacter tropicus]
MTFTFAEGVLVSDPIPKDEEIEATNADEEAGRSRLDRRPPDDLPEELLMGRLGRLDTRRALAELCKSVPGLDEVLLPRGIQADALTRKSGGGAALLRGVARRIIQDPAAWGAFSTAVQEQIPPETFDALDDLNTENLEELAAAHTTEGLLLAALSAEQTLDPAVIAGLTAAWRSEKGAAQKKASEDAHVRELEAELERLKGENERLSFASRAANERAAALAEEVDVLTGERSGASELIRKAEEQAASALDARARLDERIAELDQRGKQLERALQSERSAYSRAAERVDELHEELGRVVAERDRIKNALQNARFTDDGFGELLVRAVKNEVGAMPASLDSAARTAHLLEFMGKVLQAQADLRAPRTQAAGPAEEEAEDPDPSPAPQPEDPVEPQGPEKNGNGGYARPRPTLSFRALGGAGEVGGSSHLLDFGASRVLVDAGIKPDGRGPAAPNFGAIDRLDAAVITHAHLDHCGALPLLVRDRPGMPIYCTPPSAKLIVSALNDHAAMGGGLPGGAPIHEVRKRLVPVPFGKPLKIGETKITLTESGHILGAASVLLQSGPATVFHTGDICMEDHFSIPSAQLPDVKDIDLLIMEATLADQKPQPFSDSIRTMVETINETTMERGGSVLIPTYALGQAQEIILGLKHYGREYGLDKDVFIYVDGSVVTTSERLYAEQLGYMKPYLQHSDPREIFFSDNIRAVANDDKARERILTNPCAVIASPVTMQGGASAFYRRRLEGDPKNAVILPSNAASSYGTHRAEGEEEQWRVERVSFAAHCTQEELLGITRKLSPRQIILIHGSRRRISDLAFRLAPDHKIHTPTVGETVRTVL